MHAGQPCRSATVHNRVRMIGTPQSKFLVGVPVNVGNRPRSARDRSLPSKSSSKFYQPSTKADGDEIGRKTVARRDTLRGARGAEAFWKY